ncbi:siderophore-interacting protein (plasmid) [Streptomyces clavuligerus]|uniref:Putative siderophore-interacting protein n=1 Tax=Streptomyces clavuligerus TaxID=1901 RepID=D5SMC7_STRCL|nr:Putative siderophore-interacting protein [Streptomyces clavuligerus]QCS10992.1 siderophore-interacting protein [Streptomyces clavuligerus]QPJ98412.1 siderophore-interacting protein [Streptomyces clavuligerus]
MRPEAAGPGAAEIGIGFVGHGHGVAATRAAVARPGDPVGLNAPTGLHGPPADAVRQILTADPTGLPVVARLLENTPEHVATRGVLAVPDEASAQPLPFRPRTRVIWTYRGNGYSPGRLAELVGAALPEDSDLTGACLWTAGGPPPRAPCASASAGPRAFPRSASRSSATGCRTSAPIPGGPSLVREGGAGGAVGGPVGGPGGRHDRLRGAAEWPGPVSTGL